MISCRHPNTQKVFLEGATERLKYTLCEMQGWRPEMEDESIIITEGKDKIFGVFDGHGGFHVSRFVSKYFHTVLTSLKSYKNGNIEQALIDTFLLLDDMLKMTNVNNLMKTNEFYDDDFVFEFLAFQHITQENYRTYPYALGSDLSTNDSPKTNKRIDKSILGETSTACSESLFKNMTAHNDVSIEKEIPLNESEKNINYTECDETLNDDVYTFGGVVIDQSNDVHESLISYSTGTTANVVLIRDKVCYIANAGDSMAVLYKNGKAVRLNLEHKIFVQKERERIFRSGTNIINNRVEGRLNLTRSIGDHMFKKNTFLPNYKQAVTAFPDINKIDITPDMEFIVMGCDGIWDCVEIQDMCEYISKKRRENVPVTQILHDMFCVFISKNPYAKIGADNMTCIIIELKHI